MGDAAFPVVDGRGDLHETGPGFVQCPFCVQAFCLQGLERGLGGQQLLLAMVAFLMDGIQRGPSLLPAFLLRAQVLSQHSQFRFQAFLLLFQRPNPLPGHGLLPIQFGASGLQCGQVATPGRELGPEFGLLLTERRGFLAICLDVFVGLGNDLLPVGHRGPGIHQFAHSLMPAIPIPDSQQIPQFCADLVVLDGLFRLFFQLFQPRFDFRDDIPHAGEVVAGFGQAVHGEPPFGAIVGDARGFLEQNAAVLGPLGQNLGHHALADDSMGASAQARPIQQFVHVLEADAATIDVVFILAGTIGPTGDLHFVEVDGQPVVAIIQQDADLGHAHAGALIRPREDHVLGLFASQDRIGLFAHDPADGIGNVAFAAAVGADNGGDVAIEDDFGFIGKGFVTV